MGGAVMGNNPQETTVREVGRDLHFTDGEREMTLGVSGDLAYFRADGFIIGKDDAERIVAHLTRHFRIKYGKQVVA
jgi:hypothetical protein